jgi:hypothetical protein
MKRKQRPNVIDDGVTLAEYENLLFKLDQMNDFKEFVYLVSAPQCSDGSYNNCRTTLETKAKALLNKFEV